MKEEIQKTYHQESKIKKSRSALIGSILLIISALLPCIDVIVGRFIPGMKDLKDSEGVLVTVDIWLATLYISPAIIILASSFKPNPKLYFLPLFMFFYSGVVYFSPILGKEVDFLKFNSWLAFVISLVGALAFMYTIKYVRLINLSEIAHDNFYYDVKNEFEKLQQENTELKTKLELLQKEYEESKL